jgi:thymidylate synthase
MARPLVRCPLRRLGRKFAAAEPAWILRGDNRLASIAPYARHLTNFSDDGLRLSGAYGPKVVDQVPYVVRVLSEDPQSRQAVMTLWRERPGPSRDVPCTIALQFVVRDQALHCVATMRSSDAWLGICYDIVAFSCVSAAVAIALRSRHRDLVHRLGTLVLTAGSQHLYALDWDLARSCADCPVDEPDVAPLELDEFTSEGDLVWHLECLSNGTASPRRWLSELVGG